MEFFKNDLFKKGYESKRINQNLVFGGIDSSDTGDTVCTHAGFDCTDDNTAGIYDTTNTSISDDHCE